MTRVLVTGGAGFIGSNFVHHALRHCPDWSVVVLDKLTYAGNPENLHPLLSRPEFRFIRGDIADPRAVAPLFADGLDLVFNFAAETHVDRSISRPDTFLRTDIRGAYTLLEAARRWPVARFVQVSTDEVYGSVERGACTEDAPLRPSSPYSASKAAADGLAHAYHVTYGVPTIVTRASNTYGPRQYPEKLIPLFITNALDGLPLPLYGDGRNVRDWLHVEDHCAALLRVAESGRAGHIYNIGDGNERPNVEIAERILEELRLPHALIRRVADRPGHDRRYALDCTRLRQLDWLPRIAFEEGLRSTIAWYRDHRPWWEPLKSGKHAAYFRQRYGSEALRAGAAPERQARPRSRPRRPSPPRPPL
jgi:dTDP-glucose 4,6-dehydratase